MELHIVQIVPARFGQGHAEGAAAMAAELQIVAVDAAVGEEIEGPAKEQRLLGLPVDLVVSNFLVPAPGLQLAGVRQHDPGLAELALDDA